MAIENLINGQEYADALFSILRECGPRDLDDPEPTGQTQRIAQHAYKALVAVHGAEYVNRRMIERK